MKSIFFLLLITSCATIKPPAKNDAIKEQTAQGANLTDSIYQVMIDASDKSYTANQANYLLLENAVNNLLVINTGRPNAENIVTQINILREHLLKYETIHHDKGTLNSSELYIFKEYLKAFWSPILRSEGYLK